VCDSYVCSSWEIQVHPDFRQQGIGGQIVKAMKRMGVRYRMDKIMLTVLKGKYFKRMAAVCANTMTEENEDALKLYHKHR
jgi:ribosomal protein S18 acetylase RimI-like enzyme